LTFDITTTVGDRSAFTGPDPDIVRCSNVREESVKIAAWVKELIETENFAPYEVCITPYKPEIRSALQEAGLKTYELKPREHDPGPEEPGVRLGNMKRIKGLEFRAIVMACVDGDDAMNKLEESQLLERCERYVAATRARERLLVCRSA